MSFDLYIYAGGYWSPSDDYRGGGAHPAGRHLADGISLRIIRTVIVRHLGFEENMRKISWFPPETPGKREDIDDEATLEKVVHYGLGSGAVTLYVVREDDPYIGRRLGVAVSLLSDNENDEFAENDDNGNGDGANLEEGDNNESSGEDVDVCLSLNDSESDDQQRNEIDESKYKMFEVGQMYKTIESFKRAVNKYAMKKRRDIRYKKSDKTRVTAICSDGKCPWRVYASINSSSSRVVIRSLQEEHNCTWQGKVSLLTNARIAEIYIQEFRLNPDFSANQLQEKLLGRNINVPWKICERTRLRCLKTFDTEQAEQFARLFDYVAELRRSNAGSKVELEVRETRFFRFYVCFGGLSQGWKAVCRRIIHLDGTFLKWRMTGQLLVACGRDPNDQMFPIAWAVVDAENKPNWLWFLEHLSEDLDLNTGNGLTLASDQHRGLIAAVKAVLPFAEHRMCARHVYAYWKKSYAGAELEDLFWAAADSYYPQKFESKMKELKEYDPAAHSALKISIGCPWSRAFFSEYSKCDAVENNLGESFNAAIRIARTKPIVEMLEEIRRSVMVSNEKKKLEAEKDKGVYTPRALALLDQQIDLAKNCRSLSCGLGKYEVNYFNDRYIVHLRNETSCTCRMYLISGIPCCHIASALRLERNADQDPKTLISDWFKVDKLRACYAPGLQPVNGMNLWNVTTDVWVNPPLYKKPPGRPPGKKRRREKGEPPAKSGKAPKTGIKMHCRNCGQEGHNKTKCKNQPVLKPAKKPPGRPRVRPLSVPASLDWSTLDGASSQPDSWRAWDEAGASSSSQPVRAASYSQPPVGVSSSQPVEDVPSLSSALPRRKRGRPRKNSIETTLQPQQPASREPVYDTGPRHIPIAGYGIFTSEQSGDDYIHLGTSVRDTRDNTVLPSSLYRAREAKKRAVARGRGRGKSSSFVDNWLSSSQP